MYKITVYVPDTHVEAVKIGLFEAGAGKIGNYDCCCFQTKGTGEFRPLAGSNPYLGKKNLIEKVIETRLEMVCDNQYLKEAITALKKYHPYETPAYDVIKLESD